MTAFLFLFGVAVGLVLGFAAFSDATDDPEP